MSSSKSIPDQLIANRQKQSELRDLLDTLNEQVLFLTDVESRAAAAAAVGSNHVSEREHRLAKDDLARTVRQRDEVNTELAEAIANQDRLLDSMLNG